MTNITPADDFNELIPTPDDGTEIVATTGLPVPPGKGPVRPGYQALADRDAALHALSIYECLVPRVALAASGDTGLSFSIPGRVAGVDSNGKRWMLAGGTLNIGPDSQGGGATTWPASTWMYLYLYATTTGGTGIETSTTAPAAGLIFKSGDTSRRYLGCFCTDAQTPPRIIAMAAQRGIYRYIAPRVTSAAGTDAAYTAVPLTGLLPPHARWAYLYLFATSESGVGAHQDVYLKPGPGSADVIAVSSPRAAAGAALVRGYVDLPLPDGTLQYKVGGGSTQAAGIFVAGFSES